MAFLRSDSAREPFLKAPVSGLSLIGALVLAHVARISLSAAASERIVDTYAFVPARYAPHVPQAGILMDRAIPFVSYMFLHADVTHLAMNCLWLLAFGTVVARRFRPALFFLFFIVCGVAAAATHLLSHWNSPEGAIGASGAIAGLMAAAIRMLSVPGLQGVQMRPGLIPRLGSHVAG